MPGYWVGHNSKGFFKRLKMLKKLVALLVRELGLFASSLCQVECNMFKSSTTKDDKQLVISFILIFISSLSKWADKGNKRFGSLMEGYGWKKL